jgi:hypothetical protein
MRIFMSGGGLIEYEGTGYFSQTPTDANPGPPVATLHGQPASVHVAGGVFPSYYYGTVRSDVTSLAVELTNGQTLTVRPVAVFDAKFARYFAFAVPAPKMVAEIIAYAGGRSVGLTYPFDHDHAFALRWYSPRQAVPRPESYLIGSGTITGGAWSALTYVGPSGTCQIVYYRPRGSYPLARCPPTAIPGRDVAEVLPATFVIGPVRPELQGHSTPAIKVAHTRAAVRYLILTRVNGTRYRVPTVAVGGTRYCAFITYLTLGGGHGPKTVVRWAAYDAAGRELGSGKEELPSG